MYVVVTIIKYKGQTLRDLLIRNFFKLKKLLFLYSSNAIQVIKKLERTKKYSKPKKPNLPKPLIPINGKPIIDYNFDNLLKLGVNSFFISINYLKEMVKEHFRKKPINKIVKFVEEDSPLGTFGSLSLIDDFEHENIRVVNSDILTNVNFQLFYEKFYLYYLIHHK